MKKRNFSVLSIIFIFFPLGAIAFYSLAVLSSTYLTTRWIPTNTEKLEVIGSFQAVEGSLLRKLINDVLWIAPYENSEVYNYDYIYSERGESNLELIGETKVLLKEDTMIFIRHSEEGFSLKIESGEIDIEVGDTPIKVSADEEEYLLDEKDIKYSIKKNIDEVSIDEVSLPTVAEKKKTSKEKQESVSSKLVKKKDKEEDHRINPSYPWPASNMHFLYTQKTSISLIPVDKCTDLCALEVTKQGKVVFRDSFASGQQPHVEVIFQGNKSKKTIYKWELKSAGASLQGTFYSLPFSPKNLSELIEKQVNIHILQ